MPTCFLCGAPEIGARYSQVDLLLSDSVPMGEGEEDFVVLPATRTKPSVLGEAGIICLHLFISLCLRFIHLGGGSPISEVQFLNELCFFFF